jgi:hypothetical protein
MAFTSLKGEINQSFKEKGQTLDGVYVETKTNQGPKGNSCVHSVKKDDGEMANFWGSMAMDDMISKCKIGDYIRIEYKGLVKSKAGNDYHDWEVFKDAERSVAMEQPAPAASVTEGASEPSNGEKGGDLPWD